MALFPLLMAALCVGTSTGAIAPPSVTLFPGMSNIPAQTKMDPQELAAWPPPPPYTHTVKALGTAASLQACQASCLAYRNTEVSPVSGWVLCQSFTYVVPTGACVAVVDPYGWSPHNASSRNGDGGGGAAASASASAGARAAVTTAGLVTWPPMSKCSSDADCSYNGKCGGGGGTHTSARNEAAKGVCSCDAAWAGDRCQTLQLLPTTPTAGLRATDDGTNTSTWGGGILLDNATGLFHMWSAEMLDHCGINSWTTNSHVIHAVAKSEAGPFNRTNEVWAAFSHEPNVARAPSGEWVMYWTATAPGGATPAKCTSCTNGITPLDCPGGAAGGGPTYMSYASSPSGPWSTPALLFAAQASETNMDTNLAVVILTDGSVVGIGRTGGRGGIVAHLVTAAHWKDPNAYIGNWKTPLFSNTTMVPDAGVEDPFLYFDANGVYHAVFHNQIEADDQRLCGGHAYSVDGVDWTFTGTSWGNTVEFERESDPAVVAAHSSGAASYSYSFSRRERPHLVFGDRVDPFKITGLTTGVQYGEGAPIAKAGQDACYTLYQPVANLDVVKH